MFTQVISGLYCMKGRREGGKEEKTEGRDEGGAWEKDTN